MHRAVAHRASRLALEQRRHERKTVLAGYTLRTGGVNAVVANMASINPGTRMTGASPSYPGIAGDYARTFAVQKTLPVDVWVAGHASQYGLHDKYKPGQPDDPRRFVDPEGCRAAIARYEGLYREHLAGQRL